MRVIIGVHREGTPPLTLNATAKALDKVVVPQWPGHRLALNSVRQLSSTYLRSVPEQNRPLRCSLNRRRINQDG